MIIQASSGLETSGPSSAGCHDLHAGLPIGGPGVDPLGTRWIRCPGLIGGPRWLIYG